MMWTAITKGPPRPRHPELGPLLHRCPAGPTLITTGEIIYQTEGCSWCGAYPDSLRLNQPLKGSVID